MRNYPALRNARNGNRKGVEKVKIISPALEQYRKNVGCWFSPPQAMYGLFIIDNKIRIISSGPGQEWEHVSVSLVDRCPTWDEMAMVKNLFWGERETVLQFHPKKERYKNCHPYCLHLWKKTGIDHELPPDELI